MSVALLRKLISEVAADEKISLAEVEAMIACASDERGVTPGEAMLLEATLLAHGERFEEAAYQALKTFLAKSAK